MNHVEQQQQPSSTTNSLDVDVDVTVASTSLAGQDSAECQQPPEGVRTVVVVDVHESPEHRLDRVSLASNEEDDQESSESSSSIAESSSISDDERNQRCLNKVPQPVQQFMNGMIMPNSNGPKIDKVVVSGAKVSKIGDTTNIQGSLKIEQYFFGNPSTPTRTWEQFQMLENKKQEDKDDEKNKDNKDVKDDKDDEEKKEEPTEEPEASADPSRPLYPFRRDRVAEWFCTKRCILVICVAVLVLVTVTVLSIHLTNNSGTESTTMPPYVTASPNDSSINNDSSKFVSRAEWEALSPLQPPEKLNTLPPSYVIVTHTSEDDLFCIACKPCSTRSECVEVIQKIQKDHMKFGLRSDIGDNFLVGGDNSIYEGRGWDVIGDHTPEFDYISISIAFIGNYNEDIPSSELLDTVTEFLDLGVKEGKLAKNYKLIGQRQVMDTQSPGDLLFQQIRTWKHWAPYGAVEIVNRTEWHAKEPAKPPDKLIRLPPSYVIITHTATTFCSTKSDCINVVARIQADHMQNQSLSDIGYNFLVGGNGFIYVGRDWDVKGEHTCDYNNRSIAIAFIGNYAQDDPTREQIIAVTRLLAYGLAEEKLAKDYELFGQRQLMETESPGNNVYEIIKTWKHWSSRDDNLQIIKRYMWGAQTPRAPVNKLQVLPAPYVIISHTVSRACLSKDICTKAVRAIQNTHMQTNGWIDIGYNFLVGGDGNVYEGRGWSVEGAHSRGYNHKSIGIAFIGTFSSESPTMAQLRAAKKLIELGARDNKLSRNYKLLGHSQVSHTESPGKILFDIIKTWDHWSPSP